MARAMASVPHSLAVPLVCARLVRSTTAGLGEVRKRPSSTTTRSMQRRGPKTPKTPAAMSLTTWTHFCYSAHGPPHVRPISFSEGKLVLPRFSSTENFF